MSFEQRKEAAPGIESGTSFGLSRRLLLDVLQQSTSEAQAIEEAFWKLTADEQLELLKVAFADPNPVLEPLRKLADQLKHSVPPTDARGPGSSKSFGSLPGVEETTGTSKATAQRVEDLITEVWKMIGETRHLFGAPARGWKVPDPEAYLDPFPREHERWAVRYPLRKKLAVLVDGTPCDVVTAGKRRITRAWKLLDEVRRLTPIDRVTVRPEFMNIGGGFSEWGKGPATDCSVATTDNLLREEQHRLDVLLAQATELFHRANEEFDKQYTKRIAFFRDFRRARLLAERAVERGEWGARSLLNSM